MWFGSISTTETQMHPTFRLALALDLLAIASEQIVPGAHAVLPLGGSELSQVGAALTCAAAVVELGELAVKLCVAVRDLFLARDATEPVPKPAPHVPPDKERSG